MRWNTSGPFTPAGMVPGQHLVVLRLGHRTPRLDQYFGAPGRLISIAVMVASTDETDSNLGPSQRTE